MSKILMTSYGLEKITKANLDNIPLILSKMSVGDGTLTPSQFVISLVNERYKFTIVEPYLDPKNATQIIIDGVIPADIGGWTIKEVGLWDSADKLVAAGTLPAIVKPLPSSGAGMNLIIRLIIKVDNAGNITITVDNTEVYVTKPWCMANFHTKAQSDARFFRATTQLTDEINLNNVTTDGVYANISSTRATKEHNYPIDEAGTLYVSKSTDTHQLYITYSSNRMFSRAKYSGSWKLWQEIGGVNDAAPSTIAPYSSDKMEKTFVHKSGSETIAGEKKFSAKVQIENAAPTLEMTDTDNNKKWFVVNDGSKFEIRENNYATPRLTINPDSGNLKFDKDIEAVKFVGTATKADDSAKLEGKGAAAFFPNTKTLPAGNYTSREFWKTVEPGTYLYIGVTGGSNAPTPFGCVLVQGGVGASYEKNILWLEQPSGGIWQWAQNQNATLAGWKRFVTEPELNLAMPVGALIMIPINKPTPEGFLLCAGAEVSRTAYAKLFAYISIYFGKGDGSTTFKLPDLRGKFIRGAGGNSAQIGTIQGDAIRNITGSFFATSQNPGAHLAGAFANDGQATYTAEQGGGPRTYKFSFDASRAVPTANENRPINMAVNFFIKY